MVSNILDKYKKLSIREHIIKRPDTYVGSIVTQTTEEFVLDNGKMTQKQIEYNPALLKLFDEIITNASDHSMNNNVKAIDVIIDIDCITVKNDGPSIHIDEHPKHPGMRIPELVFGNFHSGTNFNDDEKRTVGGRNGYGAKLVAVFSKRFIIEIVKDKQKYYQEFHDGLLVKDPPKISHSTSKDYTKITYFPDFSHFGIQNNDKHHISLYERRTYDIAACTPKNTIVTFNGYKIPVKDLDTYVNLFIGATTPRVCINQPRWQICFVLNNVFDKFTQVSFVNGIFTKDGGTHVAHVIQPVVKTIIDKLSKSNKDCVIRESFVKDNIFVFINCLIENPTFTSQIKHKMTLHPSKYGSKCNLEKHIKRIIKLGIDKNVLAIANAKQNKHLLKSDGKKKKKLFGVDNLEDASLAGTAKSLDCTLFITEGLSAKTFFMSGMPKSERSTCGVFPIKGKLLNVRNASIQTISKNKEICDIKKVLGLQQNMKSIKEIKKNLRYGKIAILTDADSVAGDTPVIVRKDNKIHVKRIDDLASTEYVYISKHKAHTIVENCKKYALSNYEVWTDEGWSGIKHIMKHKVDKKLLDTMTSKGIVSVTEDHSLLTADKQEIKPGELGNNPEIVLLSHMTNELYEKCNINFGHEAFVFSNFLNFGMFQVSNNVVISIEIRAMIPDLKYIKTILDAVYGNDKFTYVFGRTDLLLVTFDIDIIQKYTNLFLKRSDINDNCKYRYPDKIHSDILNMDEESYRMFYSDFQHCSRYGFIRYSINYNICDKEFAQSIYLLHARHNPELTFGMDSGFEIFFSEVHKDNKVRCVVETYQAHEYVYDLETVNHHFQAGIGCNIVHNTDGSHIKGLIVNFIGQYWSELLKSDFVTFMQTPVVMCTNKKNKKKILRFYNLTEYNIWRQANDTQDWGIKYYKGLGTSTKSQSIDCFTNFKDNLTTLTIKEKSDEQSLSLAFDKNRTDDRKEWIINSTGKNIYLDSTLRDVPIKQFIDEEFVLFSIADNIRSLPSMMDGLKPSQRKVLYGTLLKNTPKEIKMEHLRGFISESTAYHHGEASLNGTIFGMNYDFVGSNNINLLTPKGQMGTRLELGADAAAPRYVSTMLSPITRYIYKKEDDDILTYLSDDGLKIEPVYYQPVIPMLLVNGSIGIGTGFSISTPPYNPTDLCDILLEYLRSGTKQTTISLKPWYRGFKGTVVEMPNKSFKTRGVLTITKRNTIHITEIPIGISLSGYRKFLENLMAENLVNEARFVTNAEEIEGIVKMPASVIRDLLEKDELYKFLGLESTIKKTNINCFDANNVLTTFNSPGEVLDAFFDVRLSLYEKRYNHILSKMETEIEMLSSKIRFIMGIINGSIKVFRVKQENVIAQLKKQRFPYVNNTYDYLMGIRVSSFTDEKVKMLQHEHDNIVVKHKDIKQKTHVDLWISDLENLKSKL